MAEKALQGIGTTGVRMSERSLVGEEVSGIVLEQAYQKKPIPILVGRPQTYYYDGARREHFETIPKDLWQFLRSACYEAQAKRIGIEEIPAPIYSATAFQNRDHLKIFRR